MRILQVSSAQNLGGGETHVIELTAALRSLGHEVAIAGRKDGPLQPQIVLPFVNSADLFTAVRLRGILQKQEFELVHAHVARDYTVVAAAAWRLPRVKVVFTRHLLYPVKRHFLYKRADGWLAPTSQILRTLDRLSPKRSAVIPNWVDVSKLEYRPHELHNPVTVGLIGQISPHKGHDDAVDAIRDLGGRFRLLIAGKGEANYESRLKSKAVGLPVEFLGFAPLTEFFANIDILIVPSWEEPFGIVLLEGMASGVPVIATNRGGPLEIIQSKDHGVLVPPHEPSSLARAIRELADNEERRVAIIRNAREHVEKDFDIGRVVPLIENFYERV